MEIALREWSDADAAWYVEQVKDSETLRFTTESASLTTDEFLLALNQFRRDDDALGYVAVDAEHGTRLANVAARRDGHRAHVSYWVAASARGQGVASAALKLLCERVFEVWPVAEIRLWTMRHNVASQRAAEKAGFGRDTSVDEAPEIHGRQHHDARWYRLTR
ncbi:GNAT family N-acetyltransferase [Phytoactinopolyspora mesophila]|uniref:GNAT family N-acetyltransferase n=1 Tax=Phytoactinopolyspora mesophila TaxID=2650750 RepID=A0A7K3LYH5_9ACTN|nr:GNAT family protein [Phytoactinopolyspora mesophila]NDL56040.1 GNAT family N-acetyltransferase [Phytoactinopolyspora mesophila]